MKTKIFALFLYLVLAVNALAAPFPFAFWQTSGPACTDRVFAVQATTLTGSVIRHGMECSSNGTYCMGIALEGQTGNSGTYHFYYSKDAGVTWAKYAYTQVVTTGIVETTLHGYVMTPQIRVADNGKAFAIFHNVTGPLNYHVKGVYSDLSAGSPAVTDSVAFSTDAENSVGTAGFLCANTTNNRTAFMEADTADMSFIVVVCVRENDTLTPRFFTNGGATYQNSDLATVPSHHYGSRVGLAVTGTGSSHRAFLYKKSAATNIFGYYYDQPSATSNGVGTVASGDYYIYDCDASSTKGYCLVRDNSTDAPYYFNWNVTGTPSASALKALAPQLDLDEYIGLDILENSAGQAYNYGKIPGPQVIINPSDTNHVFFATDLVHSDGIVRPSIHEVRDDTSFAGVAFSSNTYNGTQELNYNAASTLLAQTFTASATRFRSFSFAAWDQTPATPVPSGYALYCELRTTSGGAPTSTVVATSLNTIVPSHVSKTSQGERLTCVFDTQTLTGVYAVVIVATYPVSTTNSLSVNFATNAYAGGNGFRLDNGVWTDLTSDLMFEVNSEWIYDLGGVADERTTLSGSTFWGTDTSLDFVSGSTLSVLTKASPTGLAAIQRRQAGHVYRGEITMGSGSTGSTIGALAIAGYNPAKFDKGLLYNTQCGSAESGRKDAITGVVHASERCEDRSGLNHAVSSYANITQTTDGDFDSGFSTSFNGTNSLVNIGITDALKLIGVNTLFSVEAEVKPTAFTGGNSLVVSHFSSTTTTGGWTLFYNSSGNVRFQHSTTETVTTTSTTLTAGVKTLVRVWGDGSDIHIAFDDVEQAYSAQKTGGYNIVATNTGTTEVSLGAYAGNDAGWANMRLGRVRIARGASSFVSPDYYSQPELLHPINTGNIAAMLQGIGTGSTTINTGFNQWGTLVPNACFP